MTVSGLPFEGVVVLELGDRVGVAACGSLLAMAGATVIVAEAATRSSRGKFTSRAQSCAGKRSLLVRAGNQEDEALLSNAVAAADVVILSSDMPTAVGSVPNCGSDTIVCDITALGRRAANDHLIDDKLVQALSGIASVTGTNDGTATVSDASILELGTGIYAAAAIAAALRVRRIHGGGQHVEASLYATGVNGLSTFLPFHFSGKVPARGGNRHPMCAPWNAYEAKDGWILLCSANDQQWMRLCALMGRVELATEGDLATLASRVKHVDLTDAVVQTWVRQNTVAEAVEQLRDAGIAAGPILGVGDLSKDPNVQHRRMTRAIRDPESRANINVPGPPLAQGRAASAIPARDADREFVKSLCAKQVPLRDRDAQVRPLDGLRVIEIGQYTTAPLAAKQMAALGAEVIKIEPLEGESSRAWPPHLDGQSYFFTLNNTNKQSLALDLRSEEHRALFADVIRDADVLVENLKPGSLARLGFSYEELKTINPKLVYCAISGYGANSAYPGRPAFDTVIQAMCGLMDLTRAEGVPTKIGISIADTMGGMMSLYFMLAMLESRDQLGIGSFIDLAMQDVGVWATHTAWVLDERTSHTIIRCNDGDVCIACERQAVSDRMIEAKIDPKTLDRIQIVTALAELGVPAAAVRSIEEVGSAEAREGGLIRLVDDGQRRWPLLELPFRMSRMRSYDLRPVSALGAANAKFVRAAS